MYLTLSRAPNPYDVLIALAFNSYYLHRNHKISLPAASYMYCINWCLVSLFTPITRKQYHWTIALVSVLVSIPYRRILDLPMAATRDVELGLGGELTRQDDEGDFGETFRWYQASNRELMDRIMPLVVTWALGTLMMENFEYSIK